MNVFDLLSSSRDSELDEHELILKKAKTWLKEAGFPQYVQMFNDGELPISLKSVQEDHSDFDGGSLMALFRRIEILNRAGENKACQQQIEKDQKIPITHHNQTVNNKPKPYYEFIEDEDDICHTKDAENTDCMLENNGIIEDDIEDIDENLTKSDAEIKFNEEEVDNNNKINEVNDKVINNNDNTNGYDDADDDDDDDDDKENVLEQTALSKFWSFEHTTRRWSHLEPATNSNHIDNSNILQAYLGNIVPQPYISSKSKKSNDSAEYITSNSSASNLEPVFEEDDRNTSENNDKYDKPQMIKFIQDWRQNKSLQQKQPDSKDDLEGNNQLGDVRASINQASVKDDDEESGLATTSTASVGSPPEKEKSNHILRSTSLKLFKAVTRLNPNHLSFRTSKKHKDPNIPPIDINSTTSKSPISPSKDPLPPPYSPSISENSIKLRASSPPPTLFKRSNCKTLPYGGTNKDYRHLNNNHHSYQQGSINNNHDSLSLGESGWINLRTGSFISRNHNYLFDDDDDTNNDKHSLNPIMALDPVLNLLESDVKSLDVMRSKILSKSSPDTSTNSLKPRPNSCAFHSNSLLVDPNSDDFLSLNNQRLSVEIDDCNRRGKSLPANSVDNISPNIPPFNRNNASRWSHTGLHTKSLSNNKFQLLEMSVTRMNLLKKLAVLGCTSTLEKYCPPQKNIFSWRFPKLLPQKDKNSSELTNVVFGVNLTVLQSRFSCPYPPAIINIFNYIRKHGPTTQGIFRKTGMKSRIKQLKQQIEEDYNFSNFDDYNINDIADVLKTFFRDLPDRIFTNKLSATLLTIYNYVPKESQYEGLQWVILSLPDENRTALIQLLEFLFFLTKFSDETKMDVKNLSICFAPSLFSFQNDGIPMSPMRSIKKSNGPNAKFLAEQNAAHMCLMDMISNVNNIFQVNNEIMNKTENATNPYKGLDYNKLKSNANNWQDWMQVKLSQLQQDVTISPSSLSDCSTYAGSTSSPLNDVKERGWSNLNRDLMKRIYQPLISTSPQIVDVALSYRKIGGGSGDPLAIRTWKASVDIQVPPGYLFTDIKDRRDQWDPFVSHNEICDQINEFSELVRLLMPDPDGSACVRECKMIRAHQLGMHGFRHILVAESVDDMSCDCSTVAHGINNNNNNNSNNTHNKNSLTVDAHVFRDDFVVEAISSTKSRCTWLSRVDLCGHHSDWYTAQWGHSMTHRLAALKEYSESNARDVVNIVPYDSLVQNPSDNNSSCDRETIC